MKLSDKQARVITLGGVAGMCLISGNIYSWAVFIGAGLLIWMEK